ncbi:MAG: hypothetical protein ABIG44_03360 [Planctomycetota bacterium]
MRYQHCIGLTLVVGVVCGALALPVYGQATRQIVYVDESGMWIRTIVGESGDQQPGVGERDGSILWSYSHASSIASTVALCPVGGSAWAGQDLNFERMQRFEINGDGTPNLEIPGGPNSLAAVAASKYADLAATLDTDPVLLLSVYDSVGMTPLWSHTFPADYDGATSRGLAISRDGSVLACCIYDSGETKGEVRFFDAATGTPLNVWTYAGYLTAVDLTDDGSLCMVSQGSSGRVIDVATATEIFTAPGSGAGNVHQKISGNGEVLVMGGFRLEIYVWNSTTYTRVLNYSAPTSWFGRGAAVSRDGSTVGALSCDYGASYLNTSTRIWDVATVALLGQYNTFGSGSNQDSVADAEMSDDGSTFAVCSWGTQYNEHPEVMVFDRDVNMIGSIDTPGSPFALDLSGDGRYVMSGGKAVHANTMGSGGDVYMYEFELPYGLGDMNCDGAVNSYDIDGFICALSPACDYEALYPDCDRMLADCNGDGDVNSYDIDGFIALVGGG